MRRKSFEDTQCSLARAVEYIGDAWSLLILRNILNGMVAFDALQENLEIPTNTLSDRLRRLTANALLTKVPHPTDRRRCLYQLTEKGRDLYPIIIGLHQWGRKWEPATKETELSLIAKTNGKEIPSLHVRDSNGVPLEPKDVRVVIGAKASPAMRTLYAKKPGAP